MCNKTTLGRISITCYLPPSYPLAAWFPTKKILSQVVHQFANALERRQQVDVIYLDFSKAFDRVSHEKLLFKLECLV